MDLTKIKKQDTSAGGEDFTNATLAVSQLYKGQRYDAGREQRVPVAVVLKDRYETAVREAVANGTPRRELPTFSDFRTAVKDGKVSLDDMDAPDDDDDGTDLPDDFPHVGKLREQGVTTYEAVEALSGPEDVKGIGPDRWADITKAMGA